MEEKECIKCGKDGEEVLCKCCLEKMDKLSLQTLDVNEIAVCLSCVKKRKDELTELGHCSNCGSTEDIVDEEHFLCCVCDQVRASIVEKYSKLIDEE